MAHLHDWMDLLVRDAVTAIIDANMICSGNRADKKTKEVKKKKDTSASASKQQKGTTGKQCAGYLSCSEV